MRLLPIVLASAAGFSILAASATADARPNRDFRRGAEHRGFDHPGHAWGSRGYGSRSYGWRGYGWHGGYGYGFRFGGPGWGVVIR